MEERQERGGGGGRAACFCFGAGSFVPRRKRVTSCEVGCVADGVADEGCSIGSAEKAAHCARRRGEVSGEDDAEGGDYRRVGESTLGYVCLFACLPAITVMDLMSILKRTLAFWRKS